MTDPKPGKQPQDHRKKKPTIRTVYICNEEETADLYYQKAEEFAFLRMQLAMPGVEPTQELLDQRTTLDMEVKDLATKVREDAMVFKFKSIGRKKFDKLIEDNPPTKEDLKKVKDSDGDPDDLRWSPEAFFPKLVAESCFEKPESVVLDEIWDDPNWNASELAELSKAAVEANEGRRVVPLGNV